MDRLAWLKARQAGLGGSDMAAIAGVSPYQTPWSVFWSKVQPPDDEPASEAALWGSLAEGIVAEEWARRDGRQIERPDWLFVHPHHHFWIGTPDAFVLNEKGERVAGLEVKLVTEDAWRYSWDGGAQIPVHYQVQCQWYAGLCQLHEWHLAALVGGSRLETFTIQRDDRALAKLEEIGQAFWFDHVLAGVPPAPDGDQRTRDLLDEVYPAPDNPPVPCELPYDTDQLLVDYRAAAAAETDAKRAKDTAANQLIAILGQLEATDGYLPGDLDDERPAVTYRPTREVDLDSLLEAVDPDTAEQIGFCWRPKLDVKALERTVGRKLVDQHRKPTGPRRLHVRATREDNE